jgi:signal transduction histidine kinase
MIAAEKYTVRSTTRCDGDSYLKSKKPEDTQLESVASLADTARKFRALLHHANDLVYAVSIDPDERTWQLEFLSDRIFDFSGCRAEEFSQGGALGSGGPFGLANPEEHPFELVHPEDLDKAMRETRLLTEGKSVVREYRMRNKSTGEYRWVADRSEPERDSAGRVIGIWRIVRDLTERKQLELQLFQSQKMEAVGRLAGGIAHDFNNILTVILGLTESLIQDLSAIEDTGTLREDARIVRKEPASAESLTQQLLAFSRKQRFEPRAMSLGRVVEDM